MATKKNSSQSSNIDKTKIQKKSMDKNIKKSDDKVSIKKTKSIKTNSTSKIKEVSPVNSVKNKEIKTNDIVKKEKPKSSNTLKKRKSKKSFNFLHIVIAVILSFVIVGGGYLLYENVIRPTYSIQFVEAEGVEYGDYSSLTVKSGQSFSFSITVSESLIYYPQFNGVTVNGQKLEATDGVYKIDKVFSDLVIVANGYGTAGLTFDGTKLIIGKNQEKVVIPYGVTRVMPGAFSAFSSLVEVCIPSSVLELGESTFNECSHLATINISNNTMVNSQCFSGTAWLNSQPNGVVYIGGAVYTYMGTMSNGTIIEINPGTKFISPNAFAGKTGLAGITLPSSIEKIGSLSFYSCTSLANIYYTGNSLKSIGGSAFDDTLWLYNQPDGMVYFGNWLYKYKHTGEFESSFTANVKADTIGIADNAFYCVPLTAISLPNGLKYIGKESFKQCYILLNITFPETIISIGEYAFMASGISEAILPNGIQYVGDYAFMYCSGLLNVTIPESLTEFNSYLFADCINLKDIKIYSQLKNINNYVFYECGLLESITFYTNAVPKIALNTFLSASTTFNIYVPEDNVDTFKSAEGWNVFSSNVYALTE